MGLYYVPAMQAFCNCFSDKSSDKSSCLWYAVGVFKSVGYLSQWIDWGVVFNLAAVFILIAEKFLKLKFLETFSVT